MTTTRANPFRAFPIILAFLLNLVLGPIAPLAQSALVSAAPDDGIEDYAQCQIGDGAGLDCAGPPETPASWTNGILNDTHNDYAEDEVVPQRLQMEFDPNTSHTVTIRYMTRKDSSGQRHAYDYLATWNYTYVNADRCEDLPSGVDCLGGAADTFPIPSDPNSVSPGGPQPTSAHELPQADRQFVMYGGDITAATVPVHAVDPGEDGSDYASITVSFTVGASGQMQLLWGGHLASGFGPRGWGENLGAASISGGPYHMIVDAVDGESIGQRDNQIMSNAIEPLLPALTIVKTPDGGQVTAGDYATFTITVTNNGPGAATNVDIDDTLPAGSGATPLVWSEFPDKAECTVVSNVLHCDIASLADDASFSVSVRALTDADDCGLLNNTAFADADNNTQVSDTGDITVLCGDIDVDKTPDGGQVTAGDEASFTIVTTNNGDGTAKGTELSDVLPAVENGWSIDSEDWAGDCTITGDAGSAQTLACGPEDIEAGGDRSVTVSTTTTDEDCGLLDNPIAAATTDNDGSAQDDGDITVLCGEIAVDKTPDGGEVTAGDAASFTIVTSNTGDGEARDAELSDVLPAVENGWVVQSEDWAGDCTITGAAGDPQTLECGPEDIPALPGDNTRSVTVATTTTAEDCGQLDNPKAEATTSNDGTAEDSGDITVLCPDIDVDKTGSGTVNATDAIYFEITVSNIGDGDAANFEFSDTLPAIAGSWALAVGAPDFCDLTGDELTCSLETFEAGDSFTVRVEADSQVADCGDLENLASASASNESDEDLENNSDGHTIVVECPDLTATKEAGSASVSAGEDISFSITVSNDDAAGTGTAYNVELNDPLPVGPGLDWEIDPAYAGPGTCEITGALGAEVLECSFGDLEPGDSVSVRVESGTTEADCTLYTNVADVTSDNHEELNPSDDTTVECPGLNIAKTAGPSPIDAGEDASFTVTVWNTGPGTASDVTVHDELPPGVAWGEASVVGGSGEECSMASSIIEGGIEQWSFDCELGDLPVTDQAGGVQIVISGTTDRADCGVLTNVAFADADNSPQVGPAEASVTVKCPVISIEKVNDQPDPVLPGTVVSYTLTLTVDDGPAKGVVVTDVLPLGLDAPTSISDGGTYEAGTRTITWNLGDLADGSYELTYQAAVSLDAEHGDVLTNVAVVTSPNTQCPDVETVADECDDTSDVTVRVPTLVIDKEADTEVVHFVFDAEGNVLSVDPEQVTWTLTYTLTNGPVTNAVITDPVPEFLTFVSASDGGVYDDATRTITWEFPELTASGSVTFVTTVDADAPETEPIVNVATIVSDQTPSDDGEDEIRVTSESEQGGNPTPTPSVPDTALVVSPDGTPLSIPVELMVVLFLGSLGALAFANVRAARRRR